MKRMLFVSLALSAMISTAYADAPPASGPTSAPAMMRAPVTPTPVGPMLADGSRSLDSTTRKADGHTPRAGSSPGRSLQVWYQADASRIVQKDKPVAGWLVVDGIELPTGKDDIADTQAGTIAFHLDDKVAFATFVTAEGMNQHKGGIFMTTNGGKDWRRVSKDPSQGVATVDPKLAVSLGNPGVNSPARSIGVSHDGGKSWKSIAVADEDAPVPPDPSVKASNVDGAHSFGEHTPTAKDYAIRCAWHDIGYVTYDQGKSWSRCGVTAPDGAGRWGCVKFQK